MSVSFTVDDFQDLLRLLERHPEWRADLRRHMLSEELLALPSLVRELAEAQRRTEQRVDELAAAQLRSEAQLEALAAAQARTEERLGTLVAAQARTEAPLGTLADRLGTLDGEMLELRYARRAPAYFGRVALRLRELEPAALAELLDDAVQERRLTDAERETVLLADIVLSGRRREDRAEVYLLVEVSAGVGLDDVRRAADRAAVLAKLGRPVVPVDAGRSITPDAAALADSSGVWQVLNGKTRPPAEA